MTIKKPEPIVVSGISMPADAMTRPSSNPTQHSVVPAVFNAAWCKALIQSRKYERLDVHYGRTKGADSDPVHSNAFFKNLMTSCDAIRDMDAYFYRGNTPLDSEFILFLSLGRGGEGHVGMAHGGLVATMLDQTLGLGTTLFFGITGIYTVELDVRYKTAVKTPSIIVSRCWIVKQEGRRIWAKASLEDATGQLHAEANCLFIRRKDTASSVI